MPRRRRPVARQGADGWWHVWVPVGTKPNGRPDQRHIKRKTKDLAEDAADDLLDELRATGRAPRAGRKPTVRVWSETYLDSVAPNNCNPGTIDDYRSLLRNWVWPRYGDKPVDAFIVDDWDAVNGNMTRRGKAPSYRLKLFRVLSKMLAVAKRRGYVPYNVMELADPPTVDQVPIMAFADPVAERILDVVGGRRNPERWSVGFALGLRQGEALGLRWEDDEGSVLVDLDAKVFHIWWQLQRRTWRHGCGAACGRGRGADCPQRHGGGLVYVKTKGKSRRSVPIPHELVPALRRHRKAQAEQRLLQHGLWPAGEAVWTTEDGRLIDPRDDYDEWVSILQQAGVPHRKLHLMRHTAGTMLLRQGVDIRVVQEILGHRDIRTTQGYTQDVSILMVEAVAKMNAKLLRAKPKIKGVRKGVLKAVE